MPLTPGFAPGLGVEGIESGPLFDDLVRAIVIHRTVAERLAIDIDHDSVRLADGELFGGANVYSLRWQGDPGEALREISLGNLVRSIPGSPYLPIDAGGSESFALEAAASLGPMTLEALARYGSALEGRRRFRGSRLSIEADLADTGYARGRFFLLPDAGIDETGLRVVKTSPTGPILIDGRRYALLARGTDWRLDNAGARLTLSRPLAPGEELAVTYTKGGVRVGDATLGPQAIVGADGSRVDFNAGGWPQYFGDDGVTDWLFLRRQDLNSYWELRNTFVLEDLEPGQVPEQVEVQVLRTATLAPNPAYDGLADRFRIQVADAAISFEFPDLTGQFQPRPFPGEEPFAGPPYNSANNPFDPANPIYGGLSYPPADASITTARVRYLVSTDTYLLAPGLIADSVRVTVDGTSLPASSWTVDPASGTITFAPGTIGPQSEVEVVYRWTPAAGAAREFVAALGAGMGDERLGGRNLALLTLPIADAPAPRLGAERPARFADSLDVHAAFGAATGEEGWHAELAGSAAIGFSVADPAGVAIVADMEDDRRIGIGLSESRVDTVHGLHAPAAPRLRDARRPGRSALREPLGGPAAGRRRAARRFVGQRRESPVHLRAEGGTVFQRRRTARRLRPVPGPRRCVPGQRLESLGWRLHRARRHRRWRRAAAFRLAARHRHHRRSGAGAADLRGSAGQGGRRPRRGRRYRR